MTKPWAMMTMMMLLMMMTESKHAKGHWQIN